MTCSGGSIDSAAEHKLSNASTTQSTPGSTECLDNIVIDLATHSEESLCGEISSSLDFTRIIFGKLGISKLLNVKVNHCSQAYGVRIWTDEGWSLVFSGDTRPCNDLIELGKGATILIHEATFDNSKSEEAIQKKHSTVAEAYDVHRQMGSFRLILTHFSQRYPTIPPHFRFSDTSANVADDTKKYSDATVTQPNAIFASDFLDLTFSDMLWAPAATAAMAVAFPVALDDDDENTGLGDHSTIEPVRKKQKNA